MHAQSINNPLCDSSISVCPSVFDRLIKADVQAEKYKSYYVTSLAQINQYAYVITQKDSALLAKKAELSVCDQQTKTSNDALVLAQSSLSDSEKKVRIRTGIAFGAGIMAIITSFISLVRN